MHLLFDIGGTNMRFALSKDLKTFEQFETHPTPQRFRDAKQKIIQIVNKYLDSGEIISAAGGLPGPLNSSKTLLTNAPHLKGWIDEPFKKFMENLTGSKVYLENDAAMVGLGEAVYGSGKGFNIAAYITVSTGVGGARIVNSQIDQNTFGFEPGHQIINIHGVNEPKTLEDFISGSSITSKTGKKPSEIKDSEFWEEAARYLAVGLTNVSLMWSPEVIILGGGLINHDLIKIDKVESFFKDYLQIFKQTPEIKKSALGDEAGIYGAMAYLCTMI